MQPRNLRLHRLWIQILLIALMMVLGSALMASAGHGGPEKPVKEKWWDVIPESEVPADLYDSILYSEIAPKLREIQKNSRKRIRVKVMGQSAGGRNLFLVTVAAKGEDGRFGHYKQLRRLMLRDPEKALRKLEQFDDFKVPVFLNGSIHGDEYPGTDACMRLIEQLAYDDSPEVQAVLDNIILLINVVQNPDGRVLGTRRNANNFDINRDLITQSQPETRATVKVINEWNPMVFLDMHGFVDPMLIEPCTPPHNPNYEYDLYLNWALNLAYAMRDELFARTDEEEVIIPYLDWADGWDDWAPIYAAMYPMLHGSYGHTLETPHRDMRGVDAHLAVVWGALNYIVENKKAMIKDQIEVYRRGALDLPQVLIPDHLLDDTLWEQYNELTIKEFPSAYLIPAKAPLQKNPLQAAEFVDFLIFNGVEVERARRSFEDNGVSYPRGTYVVWMNQPKRSLANTLIEDGLDVSGLEGIAFYSPPAAWSHPLLWGVSRMVARDDLAATTQPVQKVTYPNGSLEYGWAGAYAFVPTTLQAFQAVNVLVANGCAVFRATKPFRDGGREFGTGTILLPANYKMAKQLKRKYRLKVFALANLPEDKVFLEAQKIAIYGEEGLGHALKEMGFSYADLSADALNAGADLAGYDLFIFGNDSWWQLNLNEAGIAGILAFIDGGGDFIALGNGGNAFAEVNALVDVSFTTAAGNGIVKLEMGSGSGLTAGYPTDEYAFVYNPFWYKTVGENVEVVARLAESDLVVSGYWPGWKESGAAGMPVVVFADDVDGTDQDFTLVGIDPAFRGHPRNAFKLIGNAIFSGIE